MNRFSLSEIKAHRVFFSFLLALILQHFELAYPELLVHPALCIPILHKHLQVRMLQLAELTPHVVGGQLSL